MRVSSLKVALYAVCEGERLESVSICEVSVGKTADRKDFRFGVADAVERWFAGVLPHSRQGFKR